MLNSDLRQIDDILSLFPSFFLSRRDDETKNVRRVELRPSQVPDSRVRHLFRGPLNGADDGSVFFLFGFVFNFVFWGQDSQRAGERAGALIALEPIALPPIRMKSLARDIIGLFGSGGGLFGRASQVDLNSIKSPEVYVVIWMTA